MRDKGQTALTDTLVEKKFCVYTVSKEFVTYNDRHEFHQTIEGKISEECSIYNQHSPIDGDSRLYFMQDGTLILGVIQKVYDVVTENE